MFFYPLHLDFVNVFFILSCEKGINMRNGDTETVPLSFFFNFM